MVDLADFDSREFELLVGFLLTREGFRITRTPAAGYSPGLLDFEVVAADGSVAFVEVKHFRRSRRLPMSALDQFMGELERLRQQDPDAHGILVTSGTLTDAAREALRSSGRIAVWEGHYVRHLLRRHPDVLPAIERAKNHRLAMESELQSLKAVAGSRGFSAWLADELAALPPGREAWRQYEELGTRVVTKLFEPALGAPDIQTRTDDQLDIMDAVFPIRATTPPWSLVRSEYQSRFAVVEFKNYQDPIGQKQVESLAQYLWKKAHRSFGLLLSRRGSDHSAQTARRRAWVEQDKLIILLSDTDLIDMAQIWEEENDPFQVIDAQLEDFLRRLTP